jgi:hypothetical protein
MEMQKSKNLEILSLVEVGVTMNDITLLTLGAMVALGTPQRSSIGTYLVIGYSYYVIILG